MGSEEKSTGSCGLVRTINEDVSLQACEFAGIDFESAGTSRGSTEEAIQVGFGVLGRGGVELGGLYRSYIKPKAEVVWQAGQVHGIGPRDLVGAPRLVALWQEFDSRLRGRVVVACPSPVHPPKLLQSSVELLAVNKYFLYQVLKDAISWIYNAANVLRKL